MRKLLLIVFIAILFSSSAKAQFGNLLDYNSGGMVSVQWDISKPVGTMSDFVPNTSYIGVNIDYKHCYKNNIIIGVRTGWNKFYENGLLIIKEEDNTISQNSIKHTVNAIPTLFVVDYMIRSEKIIPYVGFGIGGYFIGSAISYDNIITEDNNSFHFGVSPEIGVTIPSILSNFGFNMSTRYNHAFATNSASNYSWFNFSIGLSFMY